MSTRGNDDTVEQVIQLPVSKFFGNATPVVQVQFGGATHTGLVRSNNEDHYAVVRRFRSREVLLTNMPPDAYPPHEDSVYAFAVADGVGGAAFGELASEVALRTGWELTGKAFKWGFSLTQDDVNEMLENLNVYVQLMHQRIQAEGSKAAYRGMGTTLTGVLTVGRDAFVVNVGDSRAYVYRHGQLFRLTHDQTLAELMVRSGMIASVDDAAQRFRNTLVSCLGGNYSEVDIESMHLPLEDGDLILLCTDGLTDMVEEPRLAELIGQADNPQSLCDKLIQAALEGGGQDNVTVVVGKYSDVGSPPVDMQ
jgi:protein phosphatase